MLDKFFSSLDTNDHRLEKIDEIYNRLNSDQADWFVEKGISVKKKDDYWVLNYEQFAPKNEYNVLCRGLVVHALGTVSCPFFRFFNYGEPEAAKIDFNDSDVIEKLDGCFDGNVTISFCDGSHHRIKDIVDQKMTGPIWGYDHELNEIVETEITDWHSNGKTEEWVTVSITDNHNGNHKKSIICTPNHKFFTEKGYVEAKELKSGDVVYEFNLELTPIQQSFLIGTLLGDSSILNEGAKNIQWSHCPEQEALSELKCKVLSPLKHSFYQSAKSNKFTDTPGRQYRISGSKIITPIYDICYFDKKKRVNKIWLNQANDISLAVWFQDDRSMSKGNPDKQRPRALLHTEGFSSEEIDLLIEWLKTTFGIEAVKQKYRGYTCLRINVDHAEIFWRRIAYFVIPELRYKLPKEYANFPCFWDTYKEETLNNKMRQVKVINIKLGSNKIGKHSKKAHKYDITTKTHNFFAKKILVHNSLIGVFFPDDAPAWHFRNLLSTYQNDRDVMVRSFLSNKEVSLVMEVKPFLDQIKFGPEWKEFTLVFEFISHANPVITQYADHQYGLYLIGARHLPTLRELSEDDLEHVAKKLGVRRPRRWNANSYEQVLAMMADHPKDYEGFVVRDRKTGDRIKIKSEDYLKRHRLLTKLNYKNLIPLYFAGERGEIQSLMSQTKEIFDQIENSYNEFSNRVLKVLLFWQNQNVSRKEVALGMKEPKEVRAIVFKLLETTKTGQEAAVREFIRNMRAEALIEAWNLKDDLIESVVDEII